MTPVSALLQRIRDIVDALYKCMILTYLHPRIYRLCIGLRHNYLHED